MKKLNLNDLVAQAQAPAAPEEAEKATFRAEPLTVTVTDPSGNVIMTATLEPRGFKAKLDKRTGKTAGGIGWYGDVRGEDRGQYKGLPLSAGLRISVDGIKVEPGTVVDLNAAE